MVPITNFITTPELSGPFLYIYHTLITEYLREKFVGELSFLSASNIFPIFVRSLPLQSSPLLPQSGLDLSYSDEDGYGHPCWFAG
jgi:hypothetical protein